MHHKYFYNLFTMEKTATNKNSSVHFLDLVGQVLFLGISNWICKFQKFCSRFWFFVSFNILSFNCNIHDDTSNSDSNYLNRQVSSREKKDDRILTREEAKIVMENLGIFCSSDGDQEAQIRLTTNELSGLFEDEEPSLEEMKEAFHVFDTNRNGYIDASELQRVLCILGFREASKLEDCEKMINSFDENADGGIDFNEFVKLMERSF